jgi:DNA-binding NarL/FixJ family response regulator
MQVKLIVACRDRSSAIELCARVVHAANGYIAAEAADIVSVLRRAVIARPDVMLLEYALDSQEQGWNILSRVRQVSPSTRVLMLCEAYTQGMTIAFIQHGASGCLLRSSAPSVFAKAVRAVHAGETWFGRTELLQALRRQMLIEPGATVASDHHELLTAREREIMDFVRDALSNKEIARRLMISDKTVKTHLHHIYVKLQQSGRYKVLLSNGFHPASAVQLSHDAQPHASAGELKNSGPSRNGS